MPSLHALEEFKVSLGELGDERRSLAELRLPLDDLPLPSHEPSAEGPVSAIGPEFSGETEMDAGGGQEDWNPSDADGSDTDLNFGDLGDLLGSMDNQILGTPDSGSMQEAEQEDTDIFSDMSGGEEDLADFFGETAGTESPEEPAASTQEDIDFGNFIDTIPDEFSAAEPSAGIPEEDAGSPPGLLDGLADEIEAAQEEGFEEGFDVAEEPAEILPGLEEDTFDSLPDQFGETGEGEFGESLDGLDLSDEEFSDTGLGNIDLDVHPSVDSDESVELINEDRLEDEDQGQEEQGLGDFSDFDAEGAMDLSGEEIAADGENFPDEAFPAEEIFDEASTDEDMSFPEIEAEAVEEAGVPEIAGEDEGITELPEEEDEDSFDLGGEASDFDTSAVLEEISGDSFDNFKLDANELAEDFDLGGGDSADFGDSFGGMDDFSISGIDGVFNGKSPSAARKKKEDAFGEDDDEVEEIRLTEEELEQFQATLSSYPLNLRIACEELIAEQAVAPDMMSRLVKLLVDGASAREAADLAGKILKRTISIPRGFEKKTGEALEVEQASFAYIFVHNFLPVFRLFLMVTLVLLSTGYLCWKFIYTPLRAERIYKLGYERIAAGEYGRANERFLEAFRINEKKVWFYRYARAFRETRQYTLAEEKYQQLLFFTASKNKRRIPEKAAVLEYADMETNVIGNYKLADEILRHNLLDFNPYDRQALLALGDNSLAWGEYEPSRLELAREYYARFMERYGRSDPLLERMLIYFIRTDNLEEVLTLRTYFMGSRNRNISSAALAELGGYFLDKRLEKIRGVPNEFLDSIGGIREILLRAIQQDSMHPESYYQLARYYNYFENFYDERLTLDLAVRVFEAAREESPRRIRYHILTLARYGEILIRSREFFPAEEIFIKGINLYQDGLSRRLLTRSPEFGKLYTAMGDLEYFVKDGDMTNALDYYRLGEQNGWAPPEIQYRMGVAHYQLRQWGPAQDRLFSAYREITPNRRILYALGNVSYMRGNYFAAQGYYDRLLDILEADRSRLPPISATEDEKQLDLAERLMVVQNNLGVTLEGLTDRTGDNKYRSRARGLYADSQRAWDILTRNPLSFTRMRPSPDITAPGVNPAFLNVQNSLRPVSDYEAQFFLRIDKDILEPSLWEDLAPPGYRLSQGIYTGR